MLLVLPLVALAATAVALFLTGVLPPIAPAPDRPESDGELRTGPKPVALKPPAFLASKEDQDLHDNSMVHGSRLAASGKKPAEIWLRDPSMAFILIPAGTFRMGSPKNEEGRKKNESPQRAVRLHRAFYLGKYEVTQSQWRAVMGTSPAGFHGDILPVENVSWDEAMAFAEELTRLVKERNSGKTRFFLPSEAQWEFACRAETTGPYSFEGGEKKLRRAGWFRENAAQKSRPVGGLGPNPWGLYDMHGNVWEWCADPVHETYQGAPSDARVWQEGGDETRRILRGGSWLDRAHKCRSARRGCAAHAEKHKYVGFRLALVREEP